MITIALKVYEILQILIFNILQCINWSKKINKFKILRDPKKFLHAVEKSSKKFDLIRQTNSHAKVLWFHVASAGELEQIVPLAETLHTSLNAYFFVTYYSASAEPFLKNIPACLGTSGLPLDVTRVYQKAYQILPFEKLFFVRYDIWPALVLFAKNQKIELNLFAATHKKTTIGWRSYLSQKWNVFLYKKFTYIFAVTEQDAQFFRSILPQQNVIFAGDTKWHRAQQRALAFQKIVSSDSPFFQSFQAIQNDIKANQLKCVIFGSPHKEEHEIALKCLTLKEHLLIIYVPHKVSSESCAALCDEMKQHGGRPVLYSAQATQKSGYEYNVVIVDIMGHLAELYALANIAVIGGGFDGQIHNVLEPSAHGVPILIGSNFARAPEAELLVSAQAALSFVTPNILFQFLARWSTLDEDMKELQTAHQQAIKLFKSIPNTNKIILNILLQETKHDNKTTDY